MPLQELLEGARRVQAGAPPLAADQVEVFPEPGCVAGAAALSCHPCDHRQTIKPACLHKRMQLSARCGMAVTATPSPLLHPVL